MGANSATKLGLAVIILIWAIPLAMELNALRKGAPLSDVLPGITFNVLFLLGILGIAFALRFEERQSGTDRPSLFAWVLGLWFGSGSVAGLIFLHVGYSTLQVKLMTGIGFLGLILLLIHVLWQSRTNVTTS